jgi:hypothetical protein
MNVGQFLTKVKEFIAFAKAGNYIQAAIVAFELLRVVLDNMPEALTATLPVTGNADHVAALESICDQQTFAAPGDELKPVGGPLLVIVAPIIIAIVKKLLREWLNK